MAFDITLVLVPFFGVFFGLCRLFNLPVPAVDEVPTVGENMWLFKSELIVVAFSGLVSMVVSALMIVSSVRSTIFFRPDKLP